MRPQDESDRARRTHSGQVNADLPQSTSAPTMPEPDRRRARRRNRRVWAVPAGVTAAVALGITASAVAPSVATATAPALAHRTPAQLIAAVGAAGLRPLSGTIRQTSDLGLPALPGVTDSATSPTALLSGSHTARIWIGSAADQRIAVLGTLSETDYIHHGSDAWVWDSSANTVGHLVLPPADRTAGTPALPLETPAQLATALVTALRPTTSVTVGAPEWVAGRSAYELLLTPRQQGSLVDRIAIDVDAATAVPLRVRVFAVGNTDAAFTTTFTSVHFAAPATSVFAFTPPAGATVTTKTLAGSKSTTHRDAPGSTGVKVLGSGWTRVVTVSDVGALGGALGAADSATGGSSGSRAGGGQHRTTNSGVSGQLGVLLSSATRVSGSFGQGRLLRTSLLSVLILDDGRVLAGAVTPAVLERDATA